jgi:hypothetical protein
MTKKKVRMTKNELNEFSIFIDKLLSVTVQNDEMVKDLQGYLTYESLAAIDLKLTDPFKQQQLFDYLEKLKYGKNGPVIVHIKKWRNNNIRFE